MHNRVYQLKIKQFKPIILALILSFSILLPKQFQIIKFILITFSLILASNTLGIATEELSGHFSTTLSGFLNATFGNLAELIIGFFIIKQGATQLAQASITGSILSNLLLLVGLSYLIVTFNKISVKINNKQADTSSTMLLTGVLFLLFPSLLFLFNEQKYTGAISIGIAIIMLSIYVFFLIFSFITHKKWFLLKDAKHKPTLSKKTSILLMLVSIVLLTFLSEQISHIIESVGHTLHINELFLGVVLVGFVGNAAEHLSVIGLAAKGKHEFILPIAIGSSVQVVMFVAPLLVLLSQLTGNVMTLSFAPVEFFSLLVSVLLVNQIVSDKEITWFESVQILGLYIVISIIFYFAK